MLIFSYVFVRDKTTSQYSCLVYQMMFGIWPKTGVLNSTSGIFFNYFANFLLTQLPLIFSIEKLGDYKELFFDIYRANE